jgi:hypothetical protein
MSGRIVRKNEDSILNARISGVDEIGGIAKRERLLLKGDMNLEISTPALLFPAISLLFLSYTNRFLHLSALIRNLHRDWLEKKDRLLMRQIQNLRKRLILIRGMQLLGALSLLLCVVSMVSVAGSQGMLAMITFSIALGLMGLSLACLIWEIWISGGALRIMLSAMEDGEIKG